MSESDTNPAGPSGVYVYCFTRSRRLGPIASEGFDGRHDVAVMTPSSLAAVYSPVDPGDFEGAEAEQRVTDPDWVLPRACRHERVIEDVMRSGPVLPVRFGTVFRSEERLADVMRAREDALLSALDSLDGRQEWAVKGFADAETVRQWLLTADADLARTRNRLPESPGARYFAEKRLDGQVDAALGRWRRAIAGEARRHLEPHVQEIRPLPVLGSEVSGRRDDMVFNLACLVASNSEAAFRAAAGALEADGEAQGLAVQVSGPLPPYTFCPPLEAGSNDTPDVRRVR
ncbi:MAG: GvpL/GvpF family gas vesicle protein [Phycisphaerae bacterium]